MSVKTVYLLVKPTGDVRVVKRRGYITPGEVAIAVNLNLPNTWGKIVATVDVNVPDYAPDAVDVTEVRS